MAIEVIEMAPDQWNVYHSLKEEPCSCTPEWRATRRSGCGEVQLTFRTPEAAHRMASWLRFYPNSLALADIHWGFVETEPLFVKKCGCHEDARHYWNTVCPYGKAWDRARETDSYEA